jgi:hypothetical protein
MAADFRSEKMPSYEGHGRARRAWEAYARGVQKALPTAWNEALLRAATPSAAYVAREVVQQQLGFWLEWQLSGGFDGLREQGLSRSTIYKKISRFRWVMHKHPDEYELPGVTIDHEAYWRAVEGEQAARERAKA